MEPHDSSPDGFRHPPFCGFSGDSPGGSHRRTSTHIVVSEDTSKPYTDRRVFSRIFRKFRDRAGVKGRTFHDIRRTALTELGGHGATNAEIVSRSGHNINSRVLKVYIKPDRATAMNAARKRFGRDSG